MKIEEVILVNEQDVPVGRMEKLEAHRLGKLHRAFSIFIFNSKGELLLQRRAKSKYHSGGLWSNTCCGHPRPGEETDAAAVRRLFEEAGLKLKLTHQYSFSYRTEYKEGLTENEIDHVFFGTSDLFPQHNPVEADEWKYIALPELKREVATHPEKFTSWFLICLNRLNSSV